MHNVYDCVDAFSKLLKIQYKIVIGRKGKAVMLNVNFSKEDCFHLMGLQYLKDRPDLNKKRSQIFDNLLNRKISKHHIESSDFYSKIRDRIDLLPNLENIFDSNNTIFKYNKKENAYSMIEADYLLENYLFERIVYLFLSQERENHFFCRSFFPKEKRNYTKNQATWTLLYKEKVNIVTGEKMVLYNKLSEQTPYNS